MIVTSIYDSPCGQLTLGALDRSLCLCDWNIGSRRQTIDQRLCREFATTIEAGDNELLHEAKKQLDEYFFDGRQTFDLPLIFAGSDLRRSTWKK